MGNKGIVYMLFAFCICLLATTLGASSGIGGGILIKPLLDVTQSLSVATIGFLSGSTVLAMSTISLLRSRKEAVPLPLVGPLSVGAALGGAMGLLLFNSLQEALQNDIVLGFAQSGMLTALSICALVYVLVKHKINNRKVKNVIALVAIGLLLGMVGSFLGIGGGPFNLVVLYYFLSLDVKTAALSSLYIIFLSQLVGLVFMVIMGKVPPFSLPMLFVMVAGGVLGGFFGRELCGKMKEKQVEILSRALLVLVILLSAYNACAFVWQG